MLVNSYSSSRVVSSISELMNYYTYYLNKGAGPEVNV